MAPPLSRLPRRVPAPPAPRKIFPSSKDLPDAQGVLGLLSKKEISTGVAKRAPPRSVQSFAPLSIARHKPFPTKATVDNPTPAPTSAAEPLPSTDASLKPFDAAHVSEMTIVAPEDSDDSFLEEDSISGSEPVTGFKFYEDSFIDDAPDELTPEQVERKRIFDEGVAYLVANPHLLQWLDSPETPRVRRPARAPVEELPVIYYPPRDKPVFTAPPRQPTRVDSPWPASSSGQK